MNELATAVFAAEADAHLLEAPRSARFAAFRAGFDPDAYLRELTGRGFRWVARSDPAFPPRLRSIHDPPPGLFVRGEAPLEQMVQAQLRAAGMDVTIRQLELSAFLARVYGPSHDFQAAVLGVPGDPGLAYLGTLGTLAGVRW